MLQETCPQQEMMDEDMGTQKKREKVALWRAWGVCGDRSWVNFMGYRSAQGSSDTSLNVAVFAAMLS